MRAYRGCLAGLSLGLGILLLSACGGGKESPTPLPASVAIQGATSVDSDDAVQFRTSVAEPQGLTFSWDFGDGASSAEASPVHQFAAPGDYEVVLTLSNSAGESKSTSFTITARHYAMVQGLACTGEDGRAWCWQRPQPTGNEIRDIAFVDAVTGWAVGEAGQILKTTDGGLTWVAEPSHVGVTLTHVRFANASVGWALGDAGTILKTTDAGASWQQQAVLLDYPGSPEGPGLIVIDENRALVFAGYLDVRATTDGGQTWSQVQLESPQQATSDGTVWQNDFGRLLKSAGMGSAEPAVSYEAPANQVIQQFSMGTPLEGLMAVYDWDASTQKMLRTSNAGATWQPAPSIGQPADQVHFLMQFGAGTAWAVTDRGLYRSADGGLSWGAVALPADAVAADASNDPHAHDAQTFWFRHGAGYYLSTDGGAHWTWLQAEEGADSVYGLQVNAAGLWLTQAINRIHHSMDGGASWSQVFGTPAGQTADELGAVWFFDHHHGLAVGAEGWLFKTEDGGRAWTRILRMSQDTGAHPRLQFVSDTAGWMSGAWGISWTTNGGASWWTPASSGGLSDPLDFHFVDANHGWAISANQALFRTSDGGRSWQQAGTVYGRSAIRFIDNQVGVVAGSNGDVLRTVDGGATWSARTTGVSQSLGRVVFVDDHIGWAVGAEGTVITTSDAGLTWSPVTVPTQAGLNDVFFTDALHGWIVGDSGTVLATADGGKSWSTEASGATRSLRAAFFLDGYTGWIVGSNGTVLATATAGR